MNKLVLSGSFVGAVGVQVSSSIGWSSAYSRLIVGDNAKGGLVAADDITGATWLLMEVPTLGAGQITAIEGLLKTMAGASVLSILGLTGCQDGGRDQDLAGVRKLRHRH